VILTRDVAIPHLSGIVCAIVTSTVRGLPSEVPVSAESGLGRDSVVNCDNF
jgi:mRNA interferase MazF